MTDAQPTLPFEEFDGENMIVDSSDAEPTEQGNGIPLLIKFLEMFRVRPNAAMYRFTMDDVVQAARDIQCRDLAEQLKGLSSLNPSLEKDQQILNQRVRQLQNDCNYTLELLRDIKDRRASTIEDARTLYAARIRQTVRTQMNKLAS